MSAGELRLFFFFNEKWMQSGRRGWSVLKLDIIRDQPGNLRQEHAAGTSAISHVFLLEFLCFRRFAVVLALQAILAYLSSIGNAECRT